MKEMKEVLNKLYKIENGKGFFERYLKEVVIEVNGIDIVEIYMAKASS